MRLRPNKALGVVRLKANLRLIFEGVTDGNGLTNRPTRVRGRIRGQSDPVPLGDLIVD